MSEFLMKVRPIVKQLIKAFIPKFFTLIMNINYPKTLTKSSF